MKHFLLMIKDPLGRKMFSSVLSFYLLFNLAICILTCFIIPFWPEVFSAIARFACTSNWGKLMGYVFVLVLILHMLLAISIKLGNYKTNSQQHPDIKFKGLPAVLSFCLPFTGLICCIAIAYCFSLLLSFDLPNTDADYAGTMIELLRAKRVALAWFLGSLCAAFQFGRGIPGALHTLGFSTDVNKTFVHYVWRILVLICAINACYSIYYCAEIDMLLNMREDPMVIIQ